MNRLPGQQDGGQAYGLGHCVSLIQFLVLMDKALPSISQAGYGQLMKMLITLKLHQIFQSNFAYLFILRCPGTRMQNSDELFFLNLITSQ